MRRERFLSCSYTIGCLNFTRYHESIRTYFHQAGDAFWVEMKASDFWGQMSHPWWNKVMLETAFRGRGSLLLV